MQENVVGNGIVKCIKCGVDNSTTGTNGSFVASDGDVVAVEDEEITMEQQGLVDVLVGNSWNLGEFLKHSSVKIRGPSMDMMTVACSAE